MDDAGNIVNFLLNPPNLLVTTEDLLRLIETISTNKMLLAQIKRLTMMKQLNQMNVQNMANKPKIDLPAMFQKNMEMFNTFHSFACKQYEVTVKYQNEDLQSSGQARNMLVSEIEQLY
jgi:hypothetical protein